MAKTKSKAKNQSPTSRNGAHHDKHAPDCVTGPVKAVFKNHAWPASRKTLVSHARHNESFSKADLARLEKIPDRRYKSVVDVANAFEAVQLVGAVKSTQDNQQAQGTYQADGTDAYNGERSNA